MMEKIRIKLTHITPELNITPMIKKTDLKKTVVQALKISKNRIYNVEVLNEMDEVLLKFKHTD